MKMHQGRLLLYSGLLWAHGALAGTLTLNPEPVNDLLNNPGVGLEEFHDSWGQTLSLSSTPPPRSTTSFLLERAGARRGPIQLCPDRCRDRAGTARDAQADGGTQGHDAG